MAPKLACGLLLMACSASGDVLLSALPAVQVVHAGSPFSIDVVVSGLSAAGAPSLGAFEFELVFDPALVSFASAAFGPHLGTPGFDALADVMILADRVNVAEVSFIPGIVLDGVQPGSFPVVTLNFLAISLGHSPLTLHTVTLDDPDGLKLPFETQSAGVQVVPEPGSLHLLAVGGLLLTIWRRPRGTPAGCVN